MLYFDAGETYMRRQFIYGVLMVALLCPDAISGVIIAACVPTHIFPHASKRNIAGTATLVVWVNLKKQLLVRCPFSGSTAAMFALPQLLKLCVSWQAMLRNFQCKRMVLGTTSWSDGCWQYLCRAGSVWLRHQKLVIGTKKWVSLIVWYVARTR